MELKILVLPGDGIGPEVTREAVRVLEHVADKWGHALTLREGLLGGAAIHAAGTPFPDETKALALEADATLLGAVGLPEFDELPPSQRPEKGLLDIRKALDVYANLRPVQAYESLLESSPLKNAIVRGTDILIVRELTGGLYFGQPRGISGSGADETAVNSMVYRRSEIERVGRMAFDLARKRGKRLTSVDKANVLENSQLWRRTMTWLAADYPDVALDHLLVDNCAMQLILRPSSFDVLVTENPVRRHLERRGFSAGRVDRHAALGVDRQAAAERRLARALRTGPRLRARHRRARQSEPSGGDRLGGGDAAIQLRTARGSRGRRSGGAADARRGPRHGRPEAHRRAGDNRAGRAGRA